MANTPTVALPSPARAWRQLDEIKRRDGSRLILVSTSRSQDPAGFLAAVGCEDLVAFDAVDRVASLRAGVSSLPHVLSIDARGSVAYRTR